MHLISWIISVKTFQFMDYLINPLQVIFSHHERRQVVNLYSFILFIRTITCCFFKINARNLTELTPCIIHFWNVKAWIRHWFTRRWAGLCLPVAHQSHMCDSVPNLLSVCVSVQNVTKNVNDVLMRFLCCYTFGNHMRTKKADLVQILQLAGGSYTGTRWVLDSVYEPPIYQPLYNWNRPHMRMPALLNNILSFLIRFCLKEDFD